MNNLTKIAGFNALIFSAPILFPWSRKWQPTSVFLPGESHGRKSLAGYSPRGVKESDMTEQLTPPYLDSKPITSTLGMREYGDIISTWTHPHLASRTRNSLHTVVHRTRQDPCVASNQVQVGFPKHLSREKPWGGDPEVPFLLWQNETYATEQE